MKTKKPDKHELHSAIVTECILALAKPEKDDEKTKKLHRAVSESLTALRNKK